MYPNNYFSLFPPFPRNNKVFVAMSFDDKFNFRWEEVIAPSIRRTEINGTQMQPHRVDMRNVSDSILMEILEGITNDLLVIADLTTIGYLDNKPIRNGNVMYEIGLAQSIRLPEEVILLRSDSDNLLFDVTTMRVNTYDPDTEIISSQQKIFDLISEALRGLDLKRNLSIKKASTTLDYDCWVVLLLAVKDGVIKNFPTRTMGDVLSFTSKNSAIRKLLDLGALETEYLFTEEIMNHSLEASADQLLNYKPTKFGRELMNYILQANKIEKLTDRYKDEL